MNLEPEIALLENEISRISSDLQGSRRHLVEALVSGRYEAFLQSDVSKTCLNSAGGGDAEKPLESRIEESVECFMKQYADSDTEYRELVVLGVAVSCLQLFVQNNWTGPPTSLPPSDIFPSVPATTWETIEKGVLPTLSLDGEPCYGLTVYPAYLLTARTILVNCRHHLNSCQTSGLWLMRCLQTQQSLLNERSPTLKATIVELINEMKMKEPLMTENRFRNIQIQFYLEAGHLFYFYYEPKESSEHFDEAAKRSGLSIQLTGVIGKRTRYQEKALAQLMLKVERSGDQSEPEQNLPELPKDCELQDDTVLPEISVEGDETGLRTALTPPEQALLLGLCHQHKKNSESQGDILKEECLAFISKVLSQPQNWCAQSMALLLRTYWESESGRRLERTMAQLEELVNQMTTPSERPSCRTHLLYCTRWSPKWFIQKELGELLLKVGAVKSALDIFLPLELWEEVIRCYVMIGRTEAAEKVVRAQLELKETPALWCHLGDVLEDPECYRKAWEVSGHHYQAAQRSLALYHLRRGEFEESMPCFEKSLEINPLQIGAWFSYGCAGMAVKNWEKAAKGFRRCVALESQNFEAWSNLASVYMRCDQKPRAFAALQEALKCEYENWRLWENCLPLAVDVGEFEEAIRAYHRLIDLKNKYADDKVLAILVKAVTQDIEDSSGRSATRLQQRLLELMGRVTSTVTSNAEIWRQYAVLLTHAPNVTQTDRQRAAQFLHKCHRCLTQTANWQKDVAKCQDVLKETADITEMLLQIINKEEISAQASQMLASCRMMLRTTLTKVKKEHTNPVTGELDTELQTLSAQVDDQLSRVTEMSARLQAEAT